MPNFKTGSFSPIDFQFSVENQKSFQEAIDRLAATVDDFRPAFIAISSDWYRSNRKLFTLQSAGLYQDLAPVTGGTPPTTSNYKAQKLKKVGFIYPILVGQSRKLSNSILGKSNEGSVFSLGKQSLEMGTSIDYAEFHQSDKVRRVIPQRKIVFIDGGPADKSRDSAINGRRERWLNIVNDQVLQAINGEVLA